MLIYQHQTKIQAQSIWLSTEDPSCTRASLSGMLLNALSLSLSSGRSRFMQGIEAIEAIGPSALGLLGLTSLC